MARHSLLLVLVLVGCGGSVGASSSDLLAYEAATASENSSIFVVGADGRDGRRITSAKPPSVENTVSWAPDGRTVLFEGATGGAWLVDVEGGAFRHLADGWNPTWSPDGDRIALVAADGLSILTPDGEQVRSMSLPGAEKADLSSSAPTWSPDGQELAVTLVVPRPGDRWESSIYRVSVEGDQAATLVTSAEFIVEVSARWTADGEEIAFLASDGDTPPVLWAVPKSGGERRSIARDAAAFAWSPDGKVLAHASGAGEVFIGSRRVASWAQAYEIVWAGGGGRLAVSGKNGVLVLGSDGRELDRISGEVVSPSFSPDGTRIAGVGGRKVVLWDVEGSSTAELTAPEVDLSPAWSPDGARIAFTRGDPEADPENLRVFVSAADGGSERELGPGLDPQWTPDGRSILVEREGAGIYLLEADGAGERRVVANGEDPAIANRGSRIAFVRNEYRDTEEGATIERSTLATASLDGGEVSEVASISGRDERHFEAPAWLPTGELAVAVVDWFDGTGHLETVSLGGVRRVTVELTSGRFAWSPDGKRVAYVRAGRIWLDDQMLASGYAVDGPLTWSPDGDELAFVASESTNSPKEGDAALFVAPANGSEIRRIADTVLGAEPTWRSAQP